MYTWDLGLNACDYEWLIMIGSWIELILINYMPKFHWVKAEEENESREYKA